MSEEQRWQLLWQRLFRTIPPPKSPYKELSSRDTSSATPVTASKNNTRYHPYSKPREAGRAKNASEPPPASAHNSVHTETRSQVRPAIETADTQQSGVPSADVQGPGPQTTAFLERNIPSSSRTEASSNVPVRYPTPVHQHQPPQQPQQPQPPCIPSLQASSSFSFTNLVSPEDLQRNSSLYPHAGAKGSKTNQDNDNPYFPPIGETQYPVNNVPLNNMLHHNVPAGNVFENNLPSSWAPGPNSGGSQQ
ncbi:uncharacterized protein APUU_70336S [Aspergillus puulaauensis]|uniref:Uncharacterized protein n=1 Tax=Aspergillus puulaauensis TaxID=1220207 RepID=A0A7R8ART0_9EURO|nr:uncharacterized protein APUU_70336S [Aspergillus puulaauensis]BCS28766.1 hypothetical protein APUU_70336S [Aspergillus puulaauensis]